MKLRLFSTLLLAATTTTTAAKHQCRDVEIPVSVRAVPPPSLTQFSFPAISTYVHLWIGYLFLLPARGTYNIAGTHCVSTVNDELANGRLQLLVHGILGSRDYWTGLESPEQGIKAFHGTNYSYVDYALSQGYDTLAIDRLGNGQSTRANPVTTVHLPAQIEVMNSLIGEVRQGWLSQSGKDYKPKEIIWVGHSWGSVLGQALTTKYPSAVERLVLTGWTAYVDKAALTTLRYLRLIPAKWANKKRFGHRSLGYFHPTNDVGFEKLNFYGSNVGEHYDPSMPAHILSILGVVSVGELLSPGLFNGLPSTSFVGQVLVVTGRHDEFFCATSIFPGHANCGRTKENEESLLEKTGRKSFPSASRYDYYLMENTGHGVQLQFEQKKGFEEVTRWLKMTSAEGQANVRNAKTEEKVVGRDEL